MVSRLPGAVISSLLCCTLVCLSAGFSIVHNVPEWQVRGRWIGVSIVSAIVLFVFFVKLIIKPGRVVHLSAQVYSIPMCLVNCAVSVYCILQVVGVVANHSTFHAIADFDNPAGVAALLCVTFPFSLKITNNTETRYKNACLLFLLDACVLYYIQSRTGLLALISSLVVWLWLEKGGNAPRLMIRVLVVLCIIVAIVGFCFLFVGKIASTNGRLLILKTCWQMIKENPWVGHGMHGFAREYMLYQADYLRSINNVKLLMLAGNVPHPLSEFVLVVVNYGFIGLTVVLVLLCLSFRYAWKSVDRELLIVLFTGVTVLCFFSYPFRYPMTLLSLLWCLLSVMVNCLNKMSIVAKKKVSGLALIVIAISVICYYPWYKAQVLWGNMEEILSKNTDKASEIRSSLLTMTDAELFSNSRYLYSRAVVNYYARDYESALLDAQKSSLGVSSYDTELLLGEIFHKTGYNLESEMHFRMASYMCPSRIRPLYNLFRLYEDLNDTLNMVKVGNELIEKPIKVQSHDARAMRLDVRRWLMQAGY